jgi:hypothetical protein
MGIVRENIEFQRGLDPKQSMNIGFLHKWINLKKGDLFKIKRDFSTGSDNRLDDTKHYNIFQKGDYLIINDPGQQYEDDNIGFTAFIGTDQVRSHDDKFFWGTPLQFEERLEKVSRIGESINFERGLDPKKAMKIGKDFLPYKKGDKVKVYCPWEKRVVEVRVNEDEDLDSDGNPRIKKMLSTTKPAWPVRRIWVRYNGEVRTANLAIDPEFPEMDRWILYQ